MRFGYREDFSKVAIEKALYELSIWYDKWEKFNSSKHMKNKALFCKTYGIINHDRKCLYLHRGES